MKPLLRLAAAGALAVAAPAADFSYYMLALSYTPEFCSHPGGNKDPRECGPNRKAFVVHGLWPQSTNGRGPENCGPARPVAADLVRAMLQYFPTEGLIQHEWATHGTCSGLSVTDYMAAVRRAADSVRIPPEVQSLDHQLVLPISQFEGEVNQANPGLSRDEIRTACYPDGGLEEIRVCFDKNLAATPCQGASECTKMAIRLRPVKNSR